MKNDSKGYSVLELILVLGVGILFLSAGLGLCQWSLHFLNQTKEEVKSFQIMRSLGREIEQVWWQKGQGADRTEVWGKVKLLPTDNNREWQVLEISFTDPQDESKWQLRVDAGKIIWGKAQKKMLGRVILYEISDINPEMNESGENEIALGVGKKFAAVFEIEDFKKQKYRFFLHEG